VILPILRISLKVLAVVFAAAAIAAGTLAWRLSQGPVSLSFLTPYLAAALTLTERGASVTACDTSLVWDSVDSRAEIHIFDLNLIGRDGQTLIVVPEAAVGLSTRALLFGEIAPSSIQALGLVLRVSRDKAGVLDLDIGNLESETPEADAALDAALDAAAAAAVDANADADADAPAEAAADADADAFAPTGDTPSLSDRLLIGLVEVLANQEGIKGPLRYLNRLQFVDAKLTLVDHLNQVTLKAERANLTMQREIGGVRVDVDVELVLGGVPATLIGEAHYDVGRHEMAAKVQFADILLSSLAEQSPALAPLGAARLPLSGDVALVMGVDKRLQPVAFNLSAGAGEIAVDEYFPDPIKLDRASIAGRVVREGEQFHVDFNSGSVVFGETSAEFSGRISPGPIPGGDFHATIRNFPIDQLGKFWPPGVAVKARNWVLAHVPTGKVEAAEFRLKLDPAALAAGPIPEDAVQLDFTFVDGAAEYYRPLPPVTGVKGQARLTGRNFSLTASEGRIGNIEVSQGSVEIRDLHLVDQFAALEFVALGQVSDMLGVLDSDPLNLIRGFGVDPAAMGGTATARTRLDFIVEESLTPDLIKITSVANVLQASVPNVVLDYQLTEGDVALTIDNKGLDVNGIAKVNGAPVQLVWREEFDPKAPVAARYKLMAELDDGMRRAIGHPTEPYVSGLTPGHIEIEVKNDRSALLDADFDLTQAVMAVEQIDWRKPAGAAAQLKFKLAIAPNAPARMDPVTFTGPELSASGAMTFDPKGKLLEANVLNFKAGENQVHGKLRRKSDGGYQAELEGPNFDLRQIIKSSRNKKPGEVPPPSLDISLKLDKAVVGAGLLLQNVRATIGQVEDRTERMQASASMIEGGTVSMDIKREGPRRKMAVKSDNAAAVVKYINLTGLRGGTFALDAEFADDQEGSPITGVAVLEKFKAYDPPILANLLSLASFTGIVDTMRGEGVGFERADVPFSIVGDDMFLQQARSIGPALGITADGKYDFAAETLSLEGAVIPSYTINNILGKIPLLGTVLIGREHEGFFGITYTVRGPVDNLDVTVNPLSALMPGFLRRIFQLPDFGPSDKPVGEIPASESPTGEVPIIDNSNVSGSAPKKSAADARPAATGDAVPNSPQTSPSMPPVPEFSPVPETSGGPPAAPAASGASSTGKN
jgi:hypothetical protein